MSHSQLACLGTNITMVNNTYVLPDEPFPAEAMKIIEASGLVWGQSI
jgi:hypothetical protein